MTIKQILEHEWLKSGKGSGKLNIKLPLQSMISFEFFPVGKRGYPIQQRQISRDMAPVF